MKIVPQSVTLIDSMGDDLSVVNAARVSFDKESEWCGTCNDRPVLWDRDIKLINYLAKHNHFTPFTHCTATFRIKVPIFVARQIHKHQVGFTVNEVSRRYVDSEPEFFFPDTWRKKAENVKQGSSEEPFNFPEEDGFTEMEKDLSGILGWYEHLIRAGCCSEQARMILPQNMMTEFYMTGSLYGWARLCKLRLDGHTQKETQDVAKTLDKEMAQLYPVSWTALLGEQNT